MRGLTLEQFTGISDGAPEVEPEDMQPPSDSEYGMVADRYSKLVDVASDMAAMIGSALKASPMSSTVEIDACEAREVMEVWNATKI